MALRRCLILLVSIVFSAFAFNHPELRWKTVATDHFLIHYYDRTEVAVFATARIAEEVYGPLAQLYEYTPAKGKIHISLAEYDDYTNGFAEWTADNIQIWLPDDRFDLRSNTTWLRNVITHELAHIISLSKKGVQLLDWVIGVDYAGPATDVSVQTPVALTRFYPAWFAEGTAQRESERAGNDCWDSRRDMVLRSAVLDGRLLSLAEMAYFNHDGLGDEMVYNQGFSFVRYLEDAFGPNVIASLWKQGRRGPFGGGSFAQLFADHTGRTIEDLYRDWRDSLRSVYAQQVPARPSAAQPVWTRGRFNDQPRASVAAPYRGWLTSADDDFGRTDLVIMRTGETNPVARIKWAATSWCFSRDGSTVFYLKSRDNNEAGSFYNDIFSRRLSDGAERRVTANGRVYDIAACPDGSRLLCVRYANGAFSLAFCSIDNGTFTDIVRGRQGEPFQGIAINPADPSRAVTSRVIDGQANIYIVNLDSRSLTPLCQTPAQEETPAWSADGRVYFSADYDGIHNIYSILPDGGDLRRHTDVQGGAFSPSLDAQGRLLYSDYTSGGFRIASLDKSDGRPYELPSAAVCVFKPLPVPRGKVRIAARDYAAERLRAVWELQTVAMLSDPSGLVDSLVLSGDRQAALEDASFGAAVGLAMSRSDALQKKSRIFGISLLYDQGMLAGSDEASDSTDTAAIVRDLRSIEGNRRLAPPIHPYAHRLYTRMRERQTEAAVAAAQAEEDSTASSGGSLPPLFLVPQLVVQNRTLEPTLTLQVDALAYLVVPLVVQGLFDTEWHVARDWYLGVTPMVYYMPLFTAGVWLPLWLSWGTHGYVNEDIAYNRGGVSGVSAYLQPGVEPMAFIDGDGDTAGDYTTTVSAGMEVMHGFSLAKHLSLVEGFGVDFSAFNGRYFDNLGRIEAPSRRVLTVRNQVQLNFPMLRNINYGHGYYVEDLYGRVFYQVSAAGNDVMLGGSMRKYFLERDHDEENFLLSHNVGFSAILGLSNAYAFSRTLTMTLAYDWWNYRVHGSVKLGL